VNKCKFCNSGGWYDIPNVGYVCGNCLNNLNAESRESTEVTEASEEYEELVSKLMAEDMLSEPNARRLAESIVCNRN